MLNKKNLIFTFIMGLIFPGVFFISALVGFSFIDQAPRENILLSAAIIVTYLISILIGNFLILKRYGDEFKRFLLMLYYSLLTILLGISFSWFISEVL